MPHYFIDFHNDIQTTDHEGVELPDVSEVHKHAKREARELLRASIEEGHIDLYHHIAVRDESDLVVCVVRFEDIIRVTRGDEVLSQPRANA